MEQIGDRMRYGHHGRDNPTEKDFDNKKMIKTSDRIDYAH